MTKADDSGDIGRPHGRSHMTPQVDSDQPKRRGRPSKVNAERVGVLAQPVPVVLPVTEPVPDPVAPVSREQEAFNARRQRNYAQSCHYNGPVLYNAQGHAGMVNPATSPVLKIKMCDLRQHGMTFFNLLYNQQWHGAWSFGFRYDWFDDQDMPPPDYTIKEWFDAIYLQPVLTLAQLRELERNPLPDEALRTGVPYHF